MAKKPVAGKVLPSRDEPTRLMQLLRDVANGVADGDLFSSLLRCLAQGLDVSHVFVAEYAKDNPDRVHTLSVFSDGEVAENVDYILRDTPTSDVVRAGFKLVPRHVRQLFPKDALLVRLGAECYLGIPLSLLGECVGVLVAIGRKPLHDRDRDDAELVMHMLSIQAATELERRRSQRQVETALGDMLRAFETLVGNLPGMVYRCRNDSAWTMEFVSDGCRALTGYAASEFIDSTVRSYADIIHPDDRQSTYESVQAALMTGSPFQLVYRILTASGHEKWVWEQGCGVTDVFGKLLCIEGFIADITERKRVEDDLRTSEERFRGLTELSSDWYWEQDDAFCFTHVAGSVREALGIGAEEFIGRRIRDFNASSLAPGGSWADHKKALDAREPFTDFVFRLVNPQGELHYISSNGQPMFGANGAFRGYRGTAKDVTAVVRADQLLRMEHATSRCLSEAENTAAALPVLLRAVCETEMWDVGYYWHDDEKAGGLRMEGAWAVADSGMEHMTESVRNIVFARGSGVLDKVRESAEPAWISDLSQDDRLLRPDLVNEFALGGAIFFPVVAEAKVLGVLAFGSLAIREPDPRLLQSMRVISSQLGQFLKRQQAETASRENQRVLTTLLGNLPGMAYRFRKDRDDWIVEFISDGSSALTGRAPTEFIGRSVKEYGNMIHPDDRQRVWDEIQAAMASRRSFQLVYRLTAINGQEKWVWEQGSGVHDANDQYVRFEGFVTDISERVQAEAEMRKLSSAVQQTADCVIITDRDGTIEYVNAAYETTTGYSRVESVGHKPSLLKSGVHDRAFYQKLWDSVLAGETFTDVFINRKKSGELYYEEKTITPLRDVSGRVTHFISTGKDITERMRAQERLHYLAHHDGLTGLPNRVLYLDRLNQMLSRAHRSGRLVGIMFLDLDRFKYINDTLGHDVGDLLLKVIAARLRTCVREGDTVARFGGDEFAVLLDDVGQPQDVSVVAEKIVSAFTQVFQVDTHELFVTPSIGISLYPADGTTGAVLLKNADAAMYRAKDAGKNNYQFYSAELTTAAFERLTLETSLRHALTRNEFVLHYQPQIDLASGRVIGVEALIRWQHPMFGLLLPAHFISVAEETGAIIALGEWMTERALLQVKSWREGGLSDLRVAVNVSGRQLSESNFVERLERLLKSTNLPASALELEITESVLMKNADKTIEQLRALHDVGVRFAVDDFGTGYSSLSYLRRFPIHTLKIDKSFVRDLTDDSGDAEIVKTIIAMARGLKLSVVAEGVETRDQLVYLQAQGCYAAQGYLITRPLSAEQMTERLRQRGARSWLV